ncbi:GNAT family N-acetyltransferase [Candidatus Fermentibacteria bacterium]|nr:GNAT family N-acetyltransferase [Candidatus Fermentibacteria bacterium]
MAAADELRMLDPQTAPQIEQPATTMESHAMLTPRPEPVEDSLPILTRRLTLRPFVLDDAAKVFAMSQEGGMRTWIPDQVYADEREAREVLCYLISQYADPGTPAAGPYVLGVCLRGNGELVGHVGLSPLRGTVEIGYAIEEKHQGKGLASEAVAAMSEWGLRRFKLPHILGIVAADNVASCRVLERAGYALVEEAEGRLHGHQGLIRTYHCRR